MEFICEILLKLFSDVIQFRLTCTENAPCRRGGIGRSKGGGPDNFKRSHSLYGGSSQRYRAPITPRLPDCLHGLAIGSVKAVPGSVRVDRRSSKRRGSALVPSSHWRLQRAKRHCSLVGVTQRCSGCGVGKRIHRPGS